MSDLIKVTEDRSISPHSDLKFGPITRAHILNCSYNYWYPKYRTSVIKSKIIHLPSSFIKYLCSDGIVLSNDSLPVSSSTYDTDISSFPETDSDEEFDTSPSVVFPELHQNIKDSIEELGGLVAPKLNWSAPKDATWISMKKNSMECATPDDIYLLLKTSDFIAFDLEHAFDGTVEEENIKQEDIDYVLVLRKWFLVNPCFELRCFVRDRRIVAISQRDLNYFDFLFNIRDKIRDAILLFFNKMLKDSFPDPNFVFDVYIPDPFVWVRLIDINPWAPRTDPLLFAWNELLSQPQIEFFRDKSKLNSSQFLPQVIDGRRIQDLEMSDHLEMPEVRLVKKNDPQAFNFASSQYSTYKMPREVVEAGLMGNRGIQDFAAQWEKMLNGEAEMQSGFSSDDEEDN